MSFHAGQLFRTSLNYLTPKLVYRTGGECRARSKVPETNHADGRAALKTAELVRNELWTHLLALASVFNS